MSLYDGVTITMGPNMFAELTDFEIIISYTSCQKSNKAFTSICDKIDNINKIYDFKLCL